MYSLREKRIPRNVMFELSLVLTDIRSLKKSLMLNGIMGVVTPVTYERYKPGGFP